MPRFSIAIPVYNRGEYLRLALRSCLVQTVQDFEIVISDDCSSDDLQSVVNEFRDARIFYSRSSSRLGAAKNHQRAVEISRGEYVLNLHSDDFLLPDCLERAGAALDRYPAAAAVYFSSAYLEGNRVEGGSFVPNKAYASSNSWSEDSWLEQFYGTCPSSCLFRRSSFNIVGGYNTALRFAYDWYLYQRFLKQGGGVVFLPEILCVYRRHEEQCAQTSVLSAVCDMLDLWPMEENKRWSASDMAAMVVAECLATWRNGNGVAGVARVVGEVRTRRLGWRVLSGVPGAFLKKMRTRLHGPNVRDQYHYVAPVNQAQALERGNAFIRADDIITETSPL